MYGRSGAVMTNTVGDHHAVVFLLLGKRPGFYRIVELLRSLQFHQQIALFLGLQTALAKVRHVRAHDGFHNIKREAAWSHLKPRNVWKIANSDGLHRSGLSHIMMFLVFLFCIHIYACCGDAYAQETNYLIHSPNDRPHHRRKHNMHRPPYKGYDWYSHYKMDTRPDLPKTTPPHDHTHGTTKGPLTDQEKLKQLQEMETKARLLKVHEWKSHL
ncbi:GL26688 [Drosophila persimilis]|uniref:GL26688 n=1 Tax=Drosophila persimilis TaxID=7234 RepID=B4GT97_DROPE|nr:GL26688 [Drosophila persimilis]